MLRHRRSVLAPPCHEGALDPAPRPLLVYLFDPYCPWSYGYLPALSGLLDQVGSEADLEVVNIGLYHRTRIGSTAPPLLAVQRCTGVGFGPPYRPRARLGRDELASRDAAAAVIALVAADPGRVTQTLWAVHRALFWWGRSLSRSPGRPPGSRDGSASTRTPWSCSRGPSAPAPSPTRTSALARDLGARRGPTLLVSHGDQLCEFEGPGRRAASTCWSSSGACCRPRP